MDTFDCVFSDVATLINGRAYLMPELLNEGKYRIVRVGNFSGKDEWFYSNLELDDNKYCSNGDLLYKWACNFGPEIWKGEKVIYHYHIWKVLCKDNIDKIFFYYYLKYITPFWLSGTNGTTMVHITKETMEKKKITIPSSLFVQRKIADILSTYDRLIENNNKRIMLLEDIAQEIYREWFVHFRFPGYKDAVFDNGTPKGWIVSSVGKNAKPKNWKFACFSNIGNFVRGKNITAAEMVFGNIPVISAGLEPSGYHNKQNVVGQCITVSASGANAGYLSYHLSDIWAADCSFCQSDNIWFIYNSLKFLQPVISNLQCGSAQPHVYPKNINKLCTIIPDEKTIKQYCERVDSIYDQIKVLKQKNDNLAAQRDLLLPRLMKGELI